LEEKEGDMLRGACGKWAATRALLRNGGVEDARAEMATRLRCMIRCRAFGAEEAVGGVDGVSITNACAERIRELKTQNPDDANKMLRVRVDSGGCSGFQYSFSLDGDMQEEDRCVALIHLNSVLH